MTPKSQHVVKRGDQWAVRKTGSAKVTKRFDTKKEAIEVGQRIARNNRTELYIHDRYGRVLEKESFGH